MNAKIKTQLDIINSACRLLSDNDTNRIKANNAMIQTMIDHNDGVLSEAKSAEKLQKIIREAGEVIAWELFGQSAVTINKETVEANKATVSKWADDRQLKKGHHKVLDVLELRGYPVTIKTLRRETGLMIPTIYSYIHALRQEGHQIETLRKGRANPKFKLIAKAV